MICKVVSQLPSDFLKSVFIAFTSSRYIQLFGYTQIAPVSVGIDNQVERFRSAVIEAFCS